MVFLVTHDLTSQVMAQVDHLIVMAPGGRLAFFGPPTEACRYFGAPTPDAIFDRLDDRRPEEWGRHFKDSDGARKHVRTREHLNLEAATDTVGSGRRSAAGHLLTLTERYLKVKLRDRTGLIVLLAQPPILAVVMWAVFRHVTTPMLFMLALSSLWFGMSAAVRELLVDRIVWLRERQLGVGVLPYFASKVLVLGAIVAAQCTTLMWLLYSSTRLADLGEQGLGFQLSHLVGVSVLTGWAGLSLGLLVSALWNSSEAAVGTLILLLVPEICLSGIMVPLTQMPERVSQLTWLAAQRFAFDAMLKCGEHIEKYDFAFKKWKDEPIAFEIKFMGFRPEDSSFWDEGRPLEELAAILVAMTATVGILGLVPVWWRRIGRRG